MKASKTVHQPQDEFTSKQADQWLEIAKRQEREDRPVAAQESRNHAFTLLNGVGAWQ